MGIEPTSSAWKAEVLPLNYTCMYNTRKFYLIYLEQVVGIEPTSSAWKAEVLPLNYTCIFFLLTIIDYKCFLLFCQYIYLIFSNLFIFIFLLIFLKIFINANKPLLIPQTMVLDYLVLILILDEIVLL